jgi:hypothetical protein
MFYATGAMEGFYTLESSGELTHVITGFSRLRAARLTAIVTGVGPLLVLAPDLL